MGGWGHDRHGTREMPPRYVRQPRQDSRVPAEHLPHQLERLATMNDKCPECGGPITFTPGDKDGITVYFHCPNPTCKSGKANHCP